MKAEIRQGDVLEVLAGMADASMDAVVCDPPYGLSQHSQAEVSACLAAWVQGEAYAPKGTGFMGAAWDAWVPGPEVWREVLRVLKPGGHALVFAGTRSMDLMAIALRLAGFELRDAIGHAHDGGGAPLIGWCYGSGFPKSLDVGKAIEAHLVLGGSNAQRLRERDGRPTGSVETNMLGHRSGKNDDSRGIAAAPVATPEAQRWHGYGTALKPAWEPVLLARRPLDGTVAQNVLAHGTGALNIDGCRVSHASADDLAVSRSKNPGRSDKVASQVYGAGRPQQSVNDAGRWPANVTHDNSEAVVGLFPSTGGGSGHACHNSARQNIAKGTEQANVTTGHSDPPGSAARFFYAAKASPRERGEGNIHPTVKPIALATYLAKLALPPARPDGTPRRLLVPFAGSGSEVIGALAAGWDEVVGIEREDRYVAIARRRIAERLPVGDPVVPVAPVPATVAAPVPTPARAPRGPQVVPGQLTFEGLA